MLPVGVGCFTIVLVVLAREGDLDGYFPRSWVYWVSGICDIYLVPVVKAPYRRDSIAFVVDEGYIVSVVVFSWLYLVVPFVGKDLDLVLLTHHCW